MRPNIASLSLLCCMPIAVLAQSPRLEKAIDLPAKVSVEYVSVSPAGNLMGGICSDRVVRIWSMRSGELLQSLKEKGGQLGVQFSGDGRLLAISPPFGGSAAIAFSPDGRLVAIADGDGFVRVYDADTGGLRGTPTEFLLELLAEAFPPDGKSVLAGGADKAISIIDFESGKVTRVPPKQSGVVSSLDVSANGKQAAVVYRSAESVVEANHLILWDLVKETVLADFQKPRIIINGGAFVGDH